MASIVETKAVALRRGNHSENMAFTGVQGEVTVDLGYEDQSGNLGTDSNTTLRLHNGITKAGIPMARADMLNISTEVLAENRSTVNDKNLAYADLSNIEETESTAAKTKIVSAFKEYGFALETEVQAKLDNKVNLLTDNLNTSYLTSETYHPTSSTTGNKPLAYADTTNINTSYLTSSGYHTGTAGDKPLSYGDFSTSNTTNLTTLTASRPTGMSGPVLSANDCSNVNTTYLATATTSRPSTMSGPVLARADLSNIPPEAWSEQGIIEIVTTGLEKTSNKDTTIDPYNVTENHYPKTQAVIDYTDENCLNTSLSNVIDWNPLFDNSESEFLKYVGTVNSSTTGFSVGTTFKTNIVLKDDPKGTMYATVNSVDTNGAVQSLSFYNNVGSMDLSSIGTLYIKSATNVTASFTITSASNGDGTYTYAVNAITSGGSGFTANKDYIVKNSSEKALGNLIYPKLEIIVTNISTQGAITGVKTNPQYGITTVSSSVTPTTGVQITLTSSSYNATGGAGVAKNDLTNLQGMSNEDMLNETNSAWRVRHNEDLPALTETTIEDKQNYTLATNGSVWRTLKTLSNVLYNTPTVTAKAKFISSTGHTTDTATLTLLDTTTQNTSIEKYSSGSLDKCTSYMLLPNHSYKLEIVNGANTNDYHFTTGEPGTTKVIEYSLASITFNLNVQTATLSLTGTDGYTNSYPITNGTITKTITTDCNWIITKEGYSSESGTIDVETGDQTLNVSLDEES